MSGMPECRRARVTWALMRRLLAVVPVVLVAVLLSGCGGSSSASPGYDVAASQSALREAGWRAELGQGMSPLAGGKQLGWLDVVSPGGTKISLQFLESDSKAVDELAAIRKGVEGVKPDPAFAGVAIGNVLALSAPNGRRALGPSTVTDLRGLLTTK